MGGGQSKEKKQASAKQKCVDGGGSEEQCQCTEVDGGEWHPEFAALKAGALGGLIPGDQSPCITKDVRLAPPQGRD